MKPQKLFYWGTNPVTAIDATRVRWDGEWSCWELWSLDRLRWEMIPDPEKWATRDGTSLAELKPDRKESA